LNPYREEGFTFAALRCRQTPQCFRAAWAKEGPMLRSNRKLQTTSRSAYGVARDEVWPLVEFLKHLGVDERAEFQLAPSPYERNWDADAFWDGESHRFQIKRSGPLWPRPDGSLPNFGRAHQAYIRALGTGVSNFGPRQGDLLGCEFADSRGMVPKRRLLRASVVGLKDALRKVERKYRGRPGLQRIELLIHVWGLASFHVSAQEFQLIVRACRREAPRNLFKAVYVFGDRAGHFQELEART
jgi:hypothetical protein